MVQRKWPVLFTMAPTVRLMVFTGSGVGVMGKTGVVEDKGSLAHGSVLSGQAVVEGFAVEGASG